MLLSQGRLTVVLDLDGTLVSSFTPARAPRLPAGMESYIVGRGARINPNGVFVVERPGLFEFFAQLSEFAGAQHFLISSSRNILLALRNTQDTFMN